tara:strand:+ start:129 stop:1094 length:966 start_codon:yes stop_codon:yes gene_type:complete
MATNFTTSNQNSLREDLANWISNISRDLTPFKSSIGTTKASAITHEWSTDTLQAAGLQAAAEGSAYAVSTSPVITRLGNLSQIFTKGIEISGTLESVDKAGRKSEFKYQSEKRGKEIMRDIEATLVSKQLKTASASATGNIQASARLMGGYESWVGVCQEAAGSLQANSTAGTGASVWNATGTGAAFTLDDINEVLREINGVTSAAPSIVMMSTTNKVNFSNLINTSSMNTRRNIDEKGKLRQSVDLYESDFGDVEVKHNYLMADGSVFIYDPSSLALATLRPIHFRDINEVGDALRSFMVCEHTLEAKSPTGNGVITNIE